MQVKKYPKIIQILKKVLLEESSAIADILSNKHILTQIENVVMFIYKKNYNVVCFGVGKSGHIARKFAATLSSVGTKAIFIHPTEALHGDLGMIPENSVAILFSKSGETMELKQLLIPLRQLNVPIISIVNNANSTLAEKSDLFIEMNVQKEACPYNLAPTTSTTVALAIADAIAIALMELKNFSDKDFGQLHPAGSLGKRLFLQVRDIFTTKIPKVSPNSYLYKVVETMTRGRLGCTLVMDKDKLIGIITDGDIRRWIKKNMEKFIEMKKIQEDLKKEIKNINFPIFAQAKDLMSPNPKTIYYKKLAYEALKIMEEYKITQLIAVDENNKVKGIIHLHDILKEGIR